jgi:hypothetical protein
MKSPEHFFGIIGWQGQGDIGPITMYTSRRHKLVWFLRAPALNPPSPLQISQRNKWRIAAAEWWSLSASERENWLRASKVGHLRISGWNLWMYWRLTRDKEAIKTVERSTGINLLA